MKKIIFLTICFITIFLSFNQAYALITLYEEENTSQISSGTWLTNYKTLTEKGWLNTNILKVNLNDSNTKLTLLSSENGLNTFETVLQMAQKNNAIAAINGDFFAGNSKNGYTVGLSANDGKLLTSSYYENETKDTFATFVLNSKPFIDYFTETITFAKNNSDIILEIKDYNRLSDDYDNRPVIINEDFKDTTIGSTETLALTEILVKNNRITEIRYNKQSANIPTDGYAIIASGKNGEYLRNNFKKGNKVSLNIESSLDIKKVKFAVSGGAILVKDGEIPSFTADITGSHPRTAIGISKDNKNIYLITVDGRQNKSIGMTQKELAEFLISKDIYNALNLDGGGSTSMVARKLRR